ncbi:MAG: YqeG family HAD IIIA-type phosphatase [bacterium]
MCQKLIPDVYLKNVYSIDVNKLREKKKIKGIIIDLDNTLVPWGETFLDKKIISWINQVKESGLKICLVSNSRSAHVSEMGNLLNIQFYSSRYKPSKRPFIEAMKMMNTANKETAVIGDQIFTDVLGGNRLNLLTILVHPLKKHDALGTRLIYRTMERMIMSFWLKHDKIKLIKGKWPE